MAVEYEVIFHYPRIATLMGDKELAASVEVLGKDSTRHFDTVSRTIRELGGGEAPPINLEPLPEPLALRPFFLRQLEKERLMLWLHSQTAQLVSGELSAQFREMAEREKYHISLVERISAKLSL